MLLVIHYKWFTITFNLYQTIPIWNKLVKVKDKVKVKVVKVLVVDNLNRYVG
jgi:hypothetical protein